MANVNICLKHMQSYPSNGYCVYCGPPATYTTMQTQGITCSHPRLITITGGKGKAWACPDCGMFFPPATQPKVTS